VAIQLAPWFPALGIELSPKRNLDVTTLTRKHQTASTEYYPIHLIALPISDARTSISRTAKGTNGGQSAWTTLENVAS
jgi:hypothetical protein